MKKFLVMIERKPTFTGNLLQGHREFLEDLKEETLVIAGGFPDQSGGAYILQTTSLEEARKIVERDPMNHENESVYSVKEWNIR
ncbi:YciI family protein [Halalkalibacter alkalisediminis]|uniref:YciI family protein n=1 Tax=Halalkalibacter alkalisediminis TaxID=935616 RepID=A0ABV6NFB7_9BACI|nr:YciI family protein [Halalkalibacter alkalisediminis]